MATTIDINTVFELLSNPNNDLRIADSNEIVSKGDMFQGWLYTVGQYGLDNLFTKSLSIIDQTTLSEGEKANYINVFVEYFSSLEQNNKNEDDVDASGNIPGAQVSRIRKALAGSAEEISYEIDRKYSDYYTPGVDATRIGFYDLDRKENDVNFPSIIPSSINISEQLLNQPVPVLRSKSSGLIPDHRSKHIVTIDILFPTFESFSNTDKEYPSFINLLSMLKFMPVNTIQCPILSLAFITKHAFPKLMDLVAARSFDDVFEVKDNFTNAENDTARADILFKQLLGNDNITIDDIREIFTFEDVNLDIGMQAIVDSVVGSKNRFSGDDFKEESFVGVSQEDKISSVIPRMTEFPVPVAFKSASVQTNMEMPGAVIGRFSFCIMSSAAFPYGTLLYRDINGDPTSDATECYFGKKYIEIASKTVTDEAKSDINQFLGDTNYKDLPDLGLNDLRMYYFDSAKGYISFDTSGSGTILEKISGAFNTKSSEIPLMGSSFPTIQYLGMNSNSFQLIFAVTDPSVINQFMEMKSNVVSAEDNQRLQNSYAYIENAFINSLGVGRVSPQSISIDSDLDNPDLYHLTITLMENYQGAEINEKLTLEKGMENVGAVKQVWDYFYELYLIWYELEYTVGQYYSIGGATTVAQATGLKAKLNRLMNALGIKKHYASTDNNKATVLNAGVYGDEGHDIFYGPVFMGITSLYAEKNGRAWTGFLGVDFPDIVESQIEEALIETFDEVFSFEENVLRKNIQEYLYYIALGYNAEYWGSSSDKVVKADTVLSNILGFPENKNISLTAHSNTTILPGLGTLLDATIFTQDKQFDNIIDMIHKKGSKISKELWDNILTSIIERRYTKGNEVFVSYGQMNSAFTILYDLITQYSTDYMFQIKTNSNKEDTSLFRLRVRNKQDKSKVIKELQAELNISKLKGLEEDLKKINNKPINLYSDMYLPKYKDLFEVDLQLNEDDNKSIDTNYSQEGWLRKFGPKHGDSGTIPEMKSFREMTIGAKDISVLPSVTLDDFINPDIFYFRKRDKVGMFSVLEQENENSEHIKKSTATGASISIDIGYSEIVKNAIKELKKNGEISKNTPISEDDDQVKQMVNDLFLKCLTSFSATTALDSDNAIHGQNSFAPLGVTELTLNKTTDMIDLLLALGAQELTNENKPYNPQAPQRKIMHVQFTSSDNRIISDITHKPGSKYQVVPRPRIGSEANYYQTTGSLAFSMEGNDLLENNLTERTTIHTTDYTESLATCFPTVRVYFIEEDRDAEFFNDDFYGYSNVIECSISSHIYENDICRLKLANFSGILTSLKFDDFISSVEIQDDTTDPGETKNIEIMDDARERFIEKIMLRPGLHIMVKMGYENNIKTLKTVFTGEIAELTPGPVVEIVAQGYQTELHSEFGGFAEQTLTNTTAGVLDFGIRNSNAFSFSQIINFILLGHKGENNKLSNGFMKHLGTKFEEVPKYSGIFGAPERKPGYQDSNDIRRLLGTETVRQFRNQMAGKIDYGFIRNWFGDMLERNFFGFTGTDVTRNIYITTGGTHVDRNEWLSVNAPVIDGLRECIRYEPNYIATVVPYEQDATLFIGDPANAFQYRRATSLEDKYETRFKNIFNSFRKPARVVDNTLGQNQFSTQFKKLDEEINNKIIEINGTVRAQTADVKKVKENEYYLAFKTVLFSKPEEMPGWSLLTPEFKARLFSLMVNSEYRPKRINDYNDLINEILYDIDVFDVKNKSSVTEPPFKFIAEAYNPVNTFTWDQGDLTDYFKKRKPLDGQLKIQFSLNTGGRWDKYRDLFFRTEDITNYQTWGNNPDFNPDYIAQFMFNSKDRYSRKHGFSMNPPGQTGTLNKQRAIRTLSFLAIAVKATFYLAGKLISEEKDRLEGEALDYATNFDVSGTHAAQILPWNYKPFRDHHVITTEHDMIANNVAVSESDMWSAVALRVPGDTVEETKDNFHWHAFNWGIKEGDVDTDAGTYRIDSNQNFELFPSKIGGGVNYIGLHPGPKDMLENFTEVNATTETLAQNVLKFRIAQGLSKMYRGNIITLGRNIKPYDIIHLYDNVNFMYGKLMAERVIQNYTATTGWTTTIVPCGVTTVNSEMAGYGLTNFDKIIWSFAQGKTMRYIFNIITMLTFGSVGGGIKGAAYLARQSIRTFRRTLKFGVITALKSFARSTPRYMGRAISGNFAGGIGFADRIYGVKNYLVTSLGIEYSSRYAADIFYQFQNMSISQTAALYDDKNGELHIHQPCHISLLTYNLAPFIAGLEDPIAAMKNDDSFKNLIADGVSALRSSFHMRTRINTTEVLGTALGEDG